LVTQVAPLEETSRGVQRQIGLNPSGAAESLLEMIAVDDLWLELCHQVEGTTQRGESLLAQLALGLARSTVFARRTQEDGCLVEGEPRTETPLRSFGLALTELRSTLTQLGRTLGLPPTLEQGDEMLDGLNVDGIDLEGLVQSHLGFTIMLELLLGERRVGVDGAYLPGFDPLELPTV